MHVYLTISGIEADVWFAFASNYLDKAPLQLRETCKTQLCNQSEILYSWDNFREWCLCSFSVNNHETHAISQLENLREDSSVAECQAAHHVVAAQTTLPNEAVYLLVGKWFRAQDQIHVFSGPTHSQYAHTLKLHRMPILSLLLLLQSVARGELNSHPPVLGSISAHTSVQDVTMLASQPQTPRRPNGCGEDPAAVINGIVVPGIPTVLPSTLIIWEV